MTTTSKFGRVERHIDVDKIPRSDDTILYGNGQGVLRQTGDQQLAAQPAKRWSRSHEVGLPLSRRNLIAAGAALAFTGFPPIFTRPANAQGYDTSTIKALVFDVIGTCTDYWSTIVHEGQVINREKGLNVDWGAVATAWHGLFPPGFADVLNGRRPWQSLSSLRREALDKVMNEQGPGEFTADEMAHINSVWQRLELWPDTLSGLQRLKRSYTLSTLSNADMADMVKLAKFRDLPWDLIMTSELAQSVKPSPKVYQLAPQFLGLRPDEIMMVACHKQDLQAAKAQGMRTAFISRPLEAGPSGQVDAKPDPQFDLNAASFGELADLLKA
ncbi:2-haloacid dehalogenase [Rhizobium sp. BK313]|uniref:haloacid dehalogenase type II n=1 Tax=Rhizobium sp. BK313 TaxID=2587081 RepID=UPI0017AFFF55|nr:haloacid dehalogenase type II [Rhizobium sp. BK313]MBB3458299.1 2-haloacid dehalogenase [Rhizobium sp. BK313]